MNYFTGSASRGGEGLVRKLGDGNSPLNKIVTITIIIIILIFIVIIVILIIVTIITVLKNPLVDFGTCQDVIVA